MSTQKRNRWVLPLILLALTGLIVAAAIKNRKGPKGMKVAVERAEMRTLVERVAASGKVFPKTEVKISSDVSGEIVELHVQEGDSIVTGQLLAKIDPDAIQSQVERSVASVNSAKAQLANARSSIQGLIAQKAQTEAQLANQREIHRRNEQLRKDGVISQADFDASLSNLKSMEANLEAAIANIKGAEESANAAKYSVQVSEASLKEMRTNLKRTAIYAPMGGTVSSLSVEEGERVVGTIQMTGTEMMRIANLNAMEVRVEVSENDIPKVKLGDKVEVEIDAYLDRIFTGKVTQIANSSNNAAAVSLTTEQVTNFEVRISIDPSSYADIATPERPFPFRPGMSASVEILTKEARDVLTVPIQSVSTREPEDDKSDKEKGKNKSEKDDLLEVVFVVETDTVRQAVVKTGIQDDSYIRILNGLNAGDRVVIGPYSAIARNLKSGKKIQVVDEDKLFDN